MVEYWNKKEWRRGAGHVSCRSQFTTTFTYYSLSLSLLAHFRLCVMRTAKTSWVVQIELDTIAKYKKMRMQAMMIVMIFPMMDTAGRITHHLQEMVTGAEWQEQRRVEVVRRLAPLLQLFCSRKPPLILKFYSSRVSAALKLVLRP